MGASGAGKTTLLNILACRINIKKSCKLTGKVTFNEKVNVNSDIFG